MAIVKVKPQSFWSKVADWLMVPVMYVLQGTIFETPQLTHKWNNHPFPRAVRERLDFSSMVELQPLHAVRRRKHFWDFLFHAPIFGGWREYAVLTPKKNDPGQPEPWRIGWMTGDTQAISQIVLTGPVRVLYGDFNTQFFAVDTTGQQLPLEQIDTGRIAAGGQYRHVTLL